MIKLLFIIVLFLNPFSVYAQTYYFDCVGVTTGQRISDSSNRFDIQVDLSPPNLIGPRGPLSLCSLTLNNSTKVKSSCSLSNTELHCTCSGGDYIIGSEHRFSRLSGNLTFISIKKNDIFEGKYQCTPIGKKLF